MSFHIMERKDQTYTMASSLNERQEFGLKLHDWALFGYLESGRSVKTVIAELYHVSITITVSNSYRRTLQTGWKCQRSPEVRSSTHLTTPVEDSLECGMVHQWRSPTSVPFVHGEVSEHHSGTIRPIRHVLVTPLLSVFEEAHHRANGSLPSPGHMGPTTAWTLSELEQGGPWLEFSVTNYGRP